MAEATSLPDVEVKCVEKEIKKVKKKLREIENLQRLDRNLNFDEKEKLNKKDDLKKILNQLLSEYGSEYSNSSADNTLNSDITVNSSTYTSFHSEVDNHYNHITSTPITVNKRGGEGEGRSPSPPPEAPWCGRSVIVTHLLGHHDAVCSVDANGRILMSGSRDTSIKVWDLHNFCELRSLGFHSDAVTGVKILPEGDEVILHMVPSPSEQNNCCFGISGSLDCHLVLWNLETVEPVYHGHPWDPTKLQRCPFFPGKKIQAIYTYNSIQCFVYSNQHVYTGSDGGKIDAWRLCDGVNTFTLCDSGCGITCMTLKGLWLYCGRTNGSIQVWNIESSELCYDTITEIDDRDVGRAVATPNSTCCRCICQHNGVIYFGGNGTNIKVLEWKTKGIIKLANHVGVKGSTGGLAVCEHHNILLAAGYDMTTGRAMTNVRRLTDGHYLCSIQDGSTSYVSCMCVNDDAALGCLQIIAGGAKLKVIEVYQKREESAILGKDQLLLECTHIDELANNSYMTDYNESDQHHNDEEGSRTLLHVKPLPVARDTANKDCNNSYQNSWCTLM